MIIILFFVLGIAWKDVAAAMKDKRLPINYLKRWPTIQNKDTDVFQYVNPRDTLFKKKIFNSIEADPSKALETYEAWDFNLKWLLYIEDW